MASSGLKKMLNFIILYMPKVYQKIFSSQILFLLPNPILCFVMACNMPGQMLLPKVMANVEAIIIYVDVGFSFCLFKCIKLYSQ